MWLLRAGRAVRALRLARLLTSFSRGMRAFGSTMRTRGLPYVLALTFIVLLLGAAGMFTFERDEGNTSEGRLICLLLSVYAFAVFGYITATLASYFVGSDAEQERARSRRLEDEMAAIRMALERLTSGE